MRPIESHCGIHQSQGRGPRRVEWPRMQSVRSSSAAPPRTASSRDRAPFFFSFIVTRSYMLCQTRSHLCRSQVPALRILPTDDEDVRGIQSHGRTTVASGAHHRTGREGHGGNVEHFGRVHSIITVAPTTYHETSVRIERSAKRALSIVGPVSNSIVSRLSTCVLSLIDTRSHQLCQTRSHLGRSQILVFKTIPADDEDVLGVQRRGRTTMACGAHHRTGREGHGGNVEHFGRV